MTQAANYSLNIRVVATDRSRRLADKVRTAVGKVVGADVETRIDFVDSIPVGASGKHRYVESFAVPVELVGEQAVSHA